MINKTNLTLFAISALLRMSPLSQLMVPAGLDSLPETTSTVITGWADTAGSALAQIRRVLAMHDVRARGEALMEAILGWALRDAAIV